MGYKSYNDRRWTTEGGVRRMNPSCKEEGLDRFLNFASARVSSPSSLMRASINEDADDQRCCNRMTKTKKKMGFVLPRNDWGPPYVTMEL